MPLVCRQWTPIGKGTLLGSAEIELPSGLILTAVLVHLTNGKPWVAVAGLPVLDAELRQRTSPEGKREYRPLVKFANDGVRTSFKRQVLDAVRAAGAAIPEEAEP